MPSNFTLNLLRPPCGVFFYQMAYMYMQLQYLNFKTGGIKKYPTMHMNTIRTHVRPIPEVEHHKYHRAPSPPPSQSQVVFYASSYAT